MNYSFGLVWLEVQIGFHKARLCEWNIVETHPKKIITTKCKLNAHLIFFFLSLLNIKDGQADANNGLDIVAAASWWFTSAGIVIRTLLVFTNFRNFQRCIKQKSN